MTSLKPNDPLSRALAEWRVQPPTDPAFRPAVWQRIRRKTAETWAGYVQAHLAGWTLLAIVSIGVAGWAGHAAGQAAIAAERDAMVTSYLVELDPRVQAVLRPDLR